MSMAVDYWLLNRTYIDHYVSQFTSSNYYWMFPFRKFLTKKFELELEKIKSGNLSKELREIKEIIGK
tara:strand:- start:676 stop:876 length:201 start_codon:yes stop_codon:yes gene_type:complete